MDVLNQNYMAKLKTKADCINTLTNIVIAKANTLTVKQLRQLIAKHQTN
jgi:hypothetical protein